MCRLLCFAAILLTLFAGCMSEEEGSRESSADTALVRIQIGEGASQQLRGTKAPFSQGSLRQRAAGIPADVAAIILMVNRSVTVDGEDIPPESPIPIPLTGTAILEVEIAADTDHVFTIEARNQRGVGIYRGDETVNLPPGDEPRDITIDLVAIQVVTPVASQLVEAAAGGEVVVNVVGGDLRLSIPPGALTRDATITVAEVNNPQNVPVLTAEAGIIIDIDLDPDGIHLDPPATLEFPYDEDLVEELDLKEENLRIFRFDLQLNEWLPLQVQEVKKDLNVIRAQVSSFSLHQVGGEDVTPINDPPTFILEPATVPTFTVPENSALGTVVGTVVANDPDAGDSLTYSITAGNVNSAFAINATTGVITVAGSLDFETLAQYDLTITVTDTGGLTATATVQVTVTPVNDVPSFTKGPDQTVLEDAGAQTVAGWASAISAGPADESGQTLTFTVTDNSNPGLFAQPPAVAPDGTLTYTPAANANGVATVSVQLRDDGGTANGGQDTSAPQSFTITVTSVNDVPSFTKGPDQTVLEDAGAQTVAGWASAISAGPADESGQTLTFTVTDNSNPGLFAQPPAVAPDGTLTYTPAANANGVATVSVQLRDDGGTANGGQDTSAPQSFTITVTSVNDVPTVATPIADVTVAEDAANTVLDLAATFADVDIATNGDALTLTVSDNTNPALVTATLVGTTLTLAYQADQNGGATITVRATDSGTPGLFVEDSFTITVTGVNDEPIAQNDPYSAIGNVGLDVDTAEGVLANDSDVDIATNGDVLKATCDSMSAQGGDVTCDSDGSFTYNPPTGFEGNDEFAYTVQDEAGAEDTAMVTITVSNMIWFIDNTVAAGGDGRLTSPFDGLTTFNESAADEPGDIIFIGEGDGITPYAGGIVLLNDQQLIGQGVDLATATGITPPPGSLSLPGATSNPTIENATGDGITLAQDNVVRGLTVGNTPTGTGIAGTSVGILTISDVTISGTGGAVDLSAGTFDVTFDSLSSTNSPSTGVSLADCAGDFTVSTSTTIVTPSFTGLSVVDCGGSGNSFNFGDTTITGAGDGAGDGINLQTNPDAEISLNLIAPVTTINGSGLVADNGGTLTITSVDPPDDITILDIDIDATGGAAVDITNTPATTNGNDGWFFHDLTSTNSSTKGILLNNLNGMSQSMTVTGVTTVTNATDEGIEIVGSSANITFGDVMVNNRNATGINIDGATGTVITFDTVTVPNPNSVGGYGMNIRNSSAAITVASANISDTTVTDGDDGDGIFLKENTGSFTLSGGIISNSGDDGIDIRNVTDFVLDGVTITDTVDAAIFLEVNSGSTLTGTITRSTITNVGMRGIQIQPRDGGSATVMIDDNEITTIIDTVAGISVQVQMGGIGNMVITNNTIDKAVALDGISVLSQGAPASDVCVAISGNIFTGPDEEPTGEDIELDQRDTSVLALEGFTGDGTLAGKVREFLQDNNTREEPPPEVTSVRVRVRKESEISNGPAGGCARP